MGSKVKNDFVPLPLQASIFVWITLKIEVLLIRFRVIGQSPFWHPVMGLPHFILHLLDIILFGDHISYSKTSVKGHLYLKDNFCMKSEISI